MFTKATVVLVLGFALHLGAIAQNTADCSVTLSGNIIDEHDQSDLGYATIFIAEVGKGTISNSNGYYALKNLCPGKYVITVSHIGCETKEVTLDLQKDTTVNFFLEHHAELLALVTVEGLEIQRPTTQSQNVLDRLALDRNSGVSLAQSLENISGVQMLQTGPTISKPIIHGLHSNRILILNNGIRQEGQQWGSDHAPEIDPFVADRISVVKGAAAVRYGSDAIGGVILVKPDALPRQAGLQGEAYLIGMSNGQQGVLSGELQGGVNGWNGFGWRVNGTYKRAGDTRTPDYNLTNTGMRELNFSAAAGWKGQEQGVQLFYSRFESELGILRSAHVGNLTDFENAIRNEQPLIIEDFSYDIQNPKQTVSHDLLKAEGFWLLPKWGKLSAVYAFQFNDRKEFDIRRGGRSNIPALDLDLQTQTMDVTLDHPLWQNRLKGTFGLNYTFQKNRNVPGTGVEPLIPNYISYNGGLYWIERWIGDNGWELESGLRYDYKFLQAKDINNQRQVETIERNFHAWAVSFGGLWRPDSPWEFRTNFTTAFRPPNISELFSDGLHHAIASLEFGNPDLQMERGFKWIATGSYRTAAGILLEASVYNNYIENFIFLRPEAKPELTIRGAFPVFSYQQTNANLWGVDGVLRLPFAQDFFWETKGAMVRGRDLNADEHLIFMPPDRLETTVSYESASWNRLEDIRFFLTGVRTWEQTRLPDDDTDFAPPPEGYWLMHAGVGGRLPFGENRLSMQLSVRNLLDVSYRSYLNRLRYYADEVGRNVELRLKYAF